MKAENTYFFVAQYNDGEEYVQGSEDISIQDPSRNAYYDIFYAPHKPLDTLYRFGMMPTDESKPDYWVDFRDGHFEIGGHSFYPYSTMVTNPETGQQEAIKLSNPRLIYFRVTNANISMGQGKQELTSLEVAGYIVGYQCNDQFGSNHEYIMRF